MNYQLILLLTVFLVYSLKAFRFYFLLVGENIPVVNYLQVFAATTFVNSVVPFKIGEFFRFFRFGYLTHNYLKGFAIVLLDRFVDSISLIVIFVTMYVFTGIELNFIFYLLVVVCAFLTICFFALPGLMFFWNDYFIHSYSTLRHLKGLFIIKRIESIYSQIKALLKGRFFVLFILSLLSYLVELGSLYFCRRFFDVPSETLISEYLSSSMLGKEFVMQKNFTLINICFLVVIYMLMIFVQIIRKVKNRNGR